MTNVTIDAIAEGHKSDVALHRVKKPQTSQQPQSTIAVKNDHGEPTTPGVRRASLRISLLTACTANACPRTHVHMPAHHESRLWSSKPATRDYRCEPCSRQPAWNGSRTYAPDKNRTCARGLGSLRRVPRTPASRRVLRYVARPVAWRNELQHASSDAGKKHKPKCSSMLATVLFGPVTHSGLSRRKNRRFAAARSTSTKPCQHLDPGALGSVPCSRAKTVRSPVASRSVPFDRSRASPDRRRANPP
jgi:hypothetical protein